MKTRPALVVVAFVTLVTLLPISLTPSSLAPSATANAAGLPSKSFFWKRSTLPSASSLPLASLVSTSVKGTRTWTISGNCRRTGNRLTVHKKGVCRVRIVIRAKGKKPSVVRSKLLPISAASVTPPITVPTTGSTTPPLPVGASSVLWFPMQPPDVGSLEWNVPISSYVRGGDVYPLDKTLPFAEAAACEQATKVKQGLIGLFFGRQVAAGASGFGMAIPPSDIARVVAAWASGLAKCARGPWEIAVGTSNSGGITPFNGASGGAAWARVVSEARVVSDPRITISGANDLEPAWGPAARARAWVNAFVGSTSLRLWNFGSADGCPQSIGRLACANGWNIDDVLWVSSQASENLFALPQVHTHGGAQSKQWSVIAARAKQLGVPFRLGGLSVQTAACQQVRGGCPTTGISAWNAWAQFRRFIDATASIAGTPLAAPIDIRWGWGGPFYTPPPTTTTTTTTTTMTTTTTTTTTVPQETTTTVGETTSTTPTESTVPSVTTSTIPETTTTAQSVNV